MKVISSVKVPIIACLITGLVVLPRVLMFFGLENPALTVIVSPWFTFLVLMIAVGIFLSNWLWSKKYCLLGYTVVLLVAFFLTFYFCQIPLPW